MFCFLASPHAAAYSDCCSVGQSPLAVVKGTPPLFEDHFPNKNAPTATPVIQNPDSERIHASHETTHVRTNALVATVVLRIPSLPLSTVLPSKSMLRFRPYRFPSKILPRDAC